LPGEPSVENTPGGEVLLYEAADGAVILLGLHLMRHSFKLAIV
jgi:hypothetical protein